MVISLLIVIGGIVSLFILPVQESSGSHPAKRWLSLPHIPALTPYTR